MSKAKRKSHNSKQVEQTFLSKFDFNKILPPKYHVLFVILTIIVLFLIFLNPLYFGGKTFQSGDIIASKSMANYVSNHRGGYTLWNPLIFCGMPAYAIGTGYKWFNLIWVVVATIKNVFVSLFSVQYCIWTFYLIMLGITSFFLMRYLTKNTLVSLFSAIATCFSTGIIVFLFIGHVTKLVGLSMFPLVILIMLKFNKRIRLIDFLLLIISFQIIFQGFHVQIIFYEFLSIAIYYVYFFLRTLVKKDNQPKIIIKSAAVMFVAILIAAAIQSDNITQVEQYTPYSTRGGKSIVENSAVKEDQNSAGYYQYHTSWSFSPGEVMTFIIPSYYGFGNSTYNGPLTRNQDVNVNTYFGQMPFVDVAMYMGVLVFFLGLFAVFTRWKEPLVQFFAILAGLALIISFGKNLPLIFDLFFYHFPDFNKFRVPSMILVIVQISFPILAGLGIMKIISLRGEKNQSLTKLVRNLAIIFAGLFVIGVIFNSSFTQWFIGRVNDYAAGMQSTRPRLAQQFNALSGYMADMFLHDFLMAMALCTLTFGAAYYYINSKISGDTFVALVIVLTIVDLWRIDARGENYVDQPDIKGMFNTPQYVQVIKKQKDKNPFRIINIKQDGSLGSLNNDSNYNAYFMLEDMYGYSAIKPRGFQDLMDVIGPVNPTLWRMLNVKYVISSHPLPWQGFAMLYKDKNEIVYNNNNALPRAYFVDSVGNRPDLEVLKMIKQNAFDPKKIAFVNGENIHTVSPDSTAFANITAYKDEEIDLNVKATGNNFLFLSNTYIPTGWKAYIDNQKTKIYKTNHDFMGIIVPKGNHKIEFKYAPTSFYISKYTDLILSTLVLTGLIISLLLELKKRKKLHVREAT